MAGTQTYSPNYSSNIREDVSDLIMDLFPMETFVFSNADKVKASNTLHEWLADNLAAAANTPVTEGADWADTTATAATRWKNYTQILTKSFGITGTLEATNKIGRRSELARQTTKQMRELKRNVETCLISNAVATAGGTTTARSAAGIGAYIASSTTHNGNAVPGTSTSTSSTAAATSGLPGATVIGTALGYTEGVLYAALEAAWTDGGDVGVILMNSIAKNDFSAFSGVATKYNEVKGKTQGTIIGAADVYVSDFGNHMAVLSRYIPASTVLCLDMEHVKVAQLRPAQMIEVARTGDAEKRLLLWEGCAEAGNPNAHAKILGTLTA